MPDFSHENAARTQGFRIICGIDEAGRGPWAGPVVAAAVVLDEASLPSALADALDDSKKLKAQKRETLLADIGPFAAIGIGVADAGEIDRINILQATFAAMSRAVGALGDVSGFVPDLALVDGNRAPKLDCEVRTLVKGDGISLSIAAASIAAKVYRDGVMADLAEIFPGYGWERNAGYGTKAHKEALTRLGVCDAHRKSYAPIRKMLSPTAE